MTNKKEDPFEGVPKPEQIVETIRRFVRGSGREKERGRAEMRGLIGFYSTMPERAKLLAFLKRVVKAEGEQRDKNG